MVSKVNVMNLFHRDTTFMTALRSLSPFIYIVLFKRGIAAKQNDTLSNVSHSRRTMKLYPTFEFKRQILCAILKEN